LNLRSRWAVSDREAPLSRRGPSAPPPPVHPIGGWHRWRICFKLVSCPTFACVFGRALILLLAYLIPMEAIVKNSRPSLARSTSIAATVTLGCETSSNISLACPPSLYFPMERVFTVSVMREMIGSARKGTLIWHTSVGRPLKCPRLTKTMYLNPSLSTSHASKNVQSTGFIIFFPSAESAFHFIIRA
jgi:hypothetical protein